MLWHLAGGIAPDANIDNAPGFPLSAGRKNKIFQRQPDHLALKVIRRQYFAAARDRLADSSQPRRSTAG